MRSKLRTCPRCLLVFGALVSAWSLLASLAVGRWRARRARPG